MSSLVGLDRNAGRAITGVEHLRQSIADILTTPIRSRVMRPEYGSHLPRLVDLPVNNGWISTAQAEAGRAIQRWEPRIKFRRAAVTSVVDGQITIVITGEYLGENVTLEVVV